MKISVYKFKAINELENFELKPIVILSGTNSGGKTSLIQLLMTIKQTLESVGSNSPLILNKPYISLGKFKDIIYNRTLSNKLIIDLQLDKKEVRRYRFILKKITGENPESLSLKITFSFSSNRICVQEFRVVWNLEENNIWLNLSKIRSNNYKVTTNCEIFTNSEFHYFRNSNEVAEINDFIESEVKVDFIKMFPYINRSSNGGESFSPLANEYLDILLKQIFSNISYLGPLRDEPHSYYFNDDDSQLGIGNKGEFAAHILAKHARDEVTYYKIKEFCESGCVYEEVTEKLEDAVKYWI